MSGKASRGRIFRLGPHRPLLAKDVFIAPGACIIGDVEIGAGASVWFNCTIRGDTAPIRIGARSNIQDGSVIHADPGLPTIIGSDVLIGHMALIHGCTIHDRGFVGMGAIVMSGAVIESDGMLAAGAMLTGGKTVLSGQLWSGRPAKYARDLTEEEITGLREGCAHYQRNARHFQENMDLET